MKIFEAVLDVFLMGNLKNVTNGGLKVISDLNLKFEKRDETKQSTMPCLSSMDTRSSISQI